MSRYTPGPWNPIRDRDGTFFIHGENHVVAHSISVESDAKLMAASIDLLDVVKGCEFWLSTHPEGKKMQEVCRAAILEAEGV